MQRNGSLYADIWVVRNGAEADPISPKFDENSVHVFRKCKLGLTHWHGTGTEFGRKALTTYIPRIRERKVKNLLGSKEERDAAAAEEVCTIGIFSGRLSLTSVQEKSEVIVSHWHNVSPMNDGQTRNS